MEIGELDILVLKIKISLLYFLFTH